MAKNGKTTLDQAGWTLSPELRGWTRFKYPQINIDSEYEYFRDYWTMHGKTMANWDACWRVWVRRAPEFARNQRNTRPMAAVEMPYERGQRPTIGAPVQLRDHPLFKGVKP